jgi:acyl transferase domain-containing protein
MAVLRAAYANAGVQPGEVDYVEAHGTGTLLGDPIEARALGTVLGGARAQDTSLLVGAVKSNLGHLEAAAGIAGFIKTVLAIQSRIIPANVGFREPNPHIPFDQLGLKVVAETTDWPVTSHPRRAGVSSFGFGGTNAHVVIEQAPNPEPTPVQASAPPVTTLVVSGKSDDRVAATAAMLADWMDSDGAEVQVAQLAHTLNHHRSRHGKFATVAACDRRQAVDGLRGLAEGYPVPGVVRPHRGSCRPGVVFVYSGQGAQWAGMGRQLLVDEPAFAAAVAELEPVFVEQVGFSLRQVLEAGESLDGIDRIQPVLVGMQLALTELWRSYGVVPDAVIGHSMGEVAAAVVSGALSPAEGLRVIATRSRLLKRLSGQGAMALLELDADAAATVIAEHPGVDVAVYASPRQTVIAGPPEQVDAVVATVDAQDRLARRIEVDVASHHHTVDPILPELRTALADLVPKIPAIPVISTVAEQPGFDADYWVANLRNPVRFHQAIAAAGEENATFVEVSPHPLLNHAINDILAETHHHAIATLHRDTHDTLAFHTNLNATHTTHPPTTEHPPEPHPQLPTTPWRHTHHWFTRRAPKSRRNNETPHQPAPPDYDGVPSDWLHELTWPVRESVAEGAGSDTSSSWLVLGDADVATEFGQALGSDAQMAVLEPSTLDGDADKAVLLNALSGIDNVLYAPPVAAAHLDVSSAYRLFHAVRRLAATLAGLTPTPPKLFVVTRNAQPVNEGDRANPAHAILWGLGHTLTLEHPEIWGGIIDVDDAVPPELVAQYLRVQLQATDGEDQVVYRSGARHVPRLRRWHPPTEPAGRLGDGSHLVIGATGSIGPHLIRQLSDMGAKTIVAVSRRGNRLAELAASLANVGTTLVEVATDAADEAAMATLFQRFGTDLPALEGIYLAALAGGPVLLDEMTDDDVDAMFRSKLDAVSVLHKLSLKTPIRQFVLFSSITGVIGSRWLAHYTAAGAFLDAFGYARRALGLPATVIDWGLWQTSAAEQRASTDIGLQPMAPDVAIRALPTLTRPGSVVRSAVVAADWSRLAAAYRMRGSLRVVDDLLVDQAPRPRPGTLLGEATAAVNRSPAQLWRARLLPDDKPYPGSHRIHGVDVVPVSVLLATISAAATEAGATALSDIKFEYPILLDQPRIIDVEAGEESVTVSSSPAADNTAEPITHLSARVSQQLADAQPAGSESGDGHDVRHYDAAALAELQRSFGVDGQPFPWSIGSCRLGPDRLHAEIDLPEASAVALLDASVHVARLADSSNQRLMFPATVEHAWFGDGFADPHGSVQVFRRDADDGELVVDIVAKAQDGSTCVAIRALHYAAMDSAPSQANSPDQPAMLSLSEMSAETMLTELETQLAFILAHELGMPASALDKERPFPELGVDSMIAISLLREAKQLVGIDLSATMLWDHPTISSLSACIVEQLALQVSPEHNGNEDRHADAVPDSTDSVLDELFDHVESTTAVSESAI